MFDLFGNCKRKKLDKDSESFIFFLHSLSEESIRSINEYCWLSFGELQSRIVVYGFSGVLSSFCCPAFVAHRIMCAL